MKNNRSYLENLQFSNTSSMFDTLPLPGIYYLYPGGHRLFIL